jgi:hypothetical protein
VDELFLFRHGAPFRASEQQAYSRPVFLANSGNLEAKRVEKPVRDVEDRWVFRSCLAGPEQQLMAKDGR